MVVGPEHVGEVDARRAHAGRREQGVEPRRVGALRQPQATAPAGAEAGAVGVDAGPQLQAHPGVGGQQRQDGVRRRGGPRGVAAERGEQAAGPAACTAASRARANA